MSLQAGRLLTYLLVTCIYVCRGVHLTFDRTPDKQFCAQLLCDKDVSQLDEDISHITELSVYNTTLAQQAVKLASVSISRHGLYVDTSKCRTINGTGSISSREGHMALSFQDVADCLYGTFLCQLDFVTVSGQPGTTKVSTISGDSGYCPLREKLMTARLDILTLENTFLQSNVTQLSSEKLDLQSNVTQLLGEKLNLQSNVTQLLGEKLNLQSNVTQLLGENLDLQSNVTQLLGEKLNLQSNVTQLLGEKLNLQSNVTQLLGEKLNLQSNVTRLLGEKLDLQSNVTQLLGEKLDLQSNVTQLLGEKLNLQGNVTQLLGENLDLQSNVTRLLGEKLDLQSNVTQLLGEKLNLQSNVTRLLGEKLDLQSNLTRLLGEKLDLQSNVTQLLGEKLNLQSNVTQLLGEKLDLQSNVTQLLDEKLDLQSNVTQLTEEKLLLQKSLKNATQRIAKLEDLENEFINKPQVPRTTCFKGMPSTTSRQEFLLWCRIPALCDTETDGGGWVIIQRRTKGDVDFYRGWADYKKGFGTPSSDFWIGLDVIHNLTAQGYTELRFDLQDSGTNYFAHYAHFTVADEHSKYQLSVGEYKGTARDSFTIHSGRLFTTYDSDNDIHRGSNCAKDSHGAWWYDYCFDSNLNGQWGVDNDEKRIFWAHDMRLLNFTEMKVRHK